MSTKIGRSLDEINQKTKELNGNIKELTNQNKLLDKSLKFDTNPLETLKKRADNTQKSISALTERIQLLKEKQKEYDQLLSSGQITQSTYDKLSTDIAKSELQLKQLNAELKQTNTTIALMPADKFKEIGSAIENAGNKLRGLSLLATGALTGLVAIGLNANTTIDSLSVLSNKLGITAEELQYLDYISEKTDVDFTQMQKAFTKTRDALGNQLLRETNSATKALDQLGISASNFESDLDGFYAVADALGKIENSTIQATLANDIFGEKIGTEMMNFLNAGSDALKGYEDELTTIGILSNEAVDSVSEFNDSIDRIKASFKLAKNELGLALLPMMEQFANFLEQKIIPFVNNLVEKFSSLDINTKNIIVGILAFTAILSPLLLIIGKITSGIGGLLGLLPKLSSMLSLLSAHPIIAIMGLVAILLTTLYTKNEKFRESINKLFDVLSRALAPILNTVGNLLADIFEIIQPLIDIFGSVLATRINYIVTILDPLVDILEFIMKAIDYILNTGLTILGKGWIWGKEENGKTSVSDTTEVPSLENYYPTTNNSNSTVDNSIKIDSITIEKNDYVSTDDIVDVISKKLAIKVQSRG